jgi:hypothetical protein
MPKQLRVYINLVIAGFVLGQAYTNFRRRITVDYHRRRL